MKLLIDSSTNYLFLSIINDCNIKTFYREGKNDHSETLVDCMSKFLSENNLTTKDIKEIYIGRGPGSYTGLRIAGTVGKVFSYINDIKLYSFSSLDLIISKVIEEDGNYIAKIDAKKNHSYYKIVTCKNNKLHVLVDEAFGENTLFDNYPTYQILEMNEQFFNSEISFVQNIFKYQLYQEENNFDFTPNYIRSGI